MFLFNINVCEGTSILLSLYLWNGVHSSDYVSIGSARLRNGV